MELHYYWNLSLPKKNMPVKLNAFLDLHSKQDLAILDVL